MPLCINFHFYTLEKLITHLRRYHEGDGDCNIVCELEGCCHQFRHVFSFKTHIKRKHSALLQNQGAGERISHKKQMEVASNDQMLPCEVDEDDTPGLQVRDAWKIAEERAKRNERKAACF